MADVDVVLAKRGGFDDAGSALVSAWRGWALSLIVPGLWLVYVLFKMPAGQGGSVGVGKAFGVLAVVWLGLAGPVVFVLRSYCFRAVWDGRAVLAASYLRGMGSIWAVLAVGAGLGLACSVFAREAVPGVLIAGVAMLLIVITPPSKRAMVGG